MHISLQNIKKTYGSKKAQIALNGIDISLNNGEMVALIGRSGSGKSTLLNILGGLDKADCGKYIYKNKDVSHLSPNEWAKFRYNRVGFIVQNYALLDNLTVYENVSLPLKYSQNSRTVYNQSNNKVNELIGQLGLTPHKDKHPYELSGGECQRVAIARALVTDPDLILADEPTGSLDTSTEEIILDIFETLNSMGKTIVIATHDMNVANKCDKIIKLNDGEIVDILIQK